MPSYTDPLATSKENPRRPHETPRRLKTPHDETQYEQMYSNCCPQAAQDAPKRNLHGCCHGPLTGKIHWVSPKNPTNDDTTATRRPKRTRRSPSTNDEGTQTALRDPKTTTSGSRMKSAHSHGPHFNWQPMLPSDTTQEARPGDGHKRPQNGPSTPQNDPRGHQDDRKRPRTEPPRILIPPLAHGCRHT